MKRKLFGNVLDFFGLPIQNNDAKGGLLTLEQVITTALSSNTKVETFEFHKKKFDLCCKVVTRTVCDYTVEELELIRVAVCAFYTNSLIIGRVYNALENDISEGF